MNTQRLFLAVHSAAHERPGALIAFGTKAVLGSAGPWVCGKDPATHTFAIWGPIDFGPGAAPFRRLDGEPGGASCAPCAFPLPWKGVAWECSSALGDIPGAIQAAEGMRGTPYGWDEILAQSFAAAAAIERTVLDGVEMPGGLPPPPAVLSAVLRGTGLAGASVDPMGQSAICTRVTLEVLRAYLGEQRYVDFCAAEMTDLMPERLARALGRAQWATPNPIVS